LPESGLLELLPLGVLAGAAAGGDDGVVAVSHVIDELRRERLLGVEGALVDERAHARGIELPSGGDAGHHLIVDRAQQRLGLLAVRRCHLGFGEGVRRRLVFRTMLEARRDAQHVERAAKERHLDAHADEPDLADRLQPDLVERGGEIITAHAGADLAEAVGIGQCEFALGAELRQRVAQLLRLRGAEPAVADAREDALDAAIALRALDAVEHVAQGRLLAEEDALDAVVGASFRQRLGEIERHDAVVGKRLLAGRGEEPDADHDGDHQENESKADDREEADDEAAHEGTLLGVYELRRLSAEGASAATSALNLCFRRCHRPSVQPHCARCRNR
jgi:hypothetical protein